MITEVQLSNNRLHFLYLQKVISSIAGSVGMCRRDMEDMGKAVAEVCITSLCAMSESLSGSLCITLAADSSQMTAEIVNRNAGFEPACSGECFDDSDYARGMEIAKRLVDSAELLHGSDEITIRLMKQVSDYESHIEFSNPGILSLSGTTTGS